MVRVCPAPSAPFTETDVSCRRPAGGRRQDDTPVPDADRIGSGNRSTRGIVPVTETPRGRPQDDLSASTIRHPNSTLMATCSRPLAGVLARLVLEELWQRTTVHSTSREAR